METHRFISRLKSQAWLLVCSTVVSFAAGSVVTARLRHVEPVNAESNRVFELMIYHTLPGKEPALESLFRESDKLKAKHGLQVIGYWVPNEDPAWANTIIYLVAHPSRAEADANWQALHTDPAFLPSRRTAESLIEHTNDDYKVDEIYMRPTDFSAVK